jgi:hypothetical protein
MAVLLEFLQGVRIGGLGHGEGARGVEEKWRKPQWPGSSGR